MKHLFFILATICIVFFIYLGMAYITMMPHNTEMTEVDDANGVVFIKSEIQNKSQTQPNKSSLAIKPKNPNNPINLKTHQFSDINNEQFKPLDNSKRNEINPNIPTNFNKDFVPSIGKLNLGSHIKKLYPYEAYRNNINGSVLLKLFISKAGKVVDVEVLDSTPKGLFESIAVQEAYKKVFPVNVNNHDPKDYTRNIRTQYNSTD